MATSSGTYNWNLDVAKIIETAGRRVRPKDAGAMSAAEAQDARDNLNMVLNDMLVSRQGSPLSAIQKGTVPLLYDVSSYVLPSNVIDTVDVTFVKNNVETPLTRVPFLEFNKFGTLDTRAGTVSQYTIEKRADATVLHVYPKPDTDANQYFVNYWAIHRIQDVTAANQGVNLSILYTNALIAGTSYYMGLERNDVDENKLARLKMNYDDELDKAMGEDRDRASMFVVPTLRRR